MTHHQRQQLASAQHYHENREPWSDGADEDPQESVCGDCDCDFKYTPSAHKWRGRYETPPYCKACQQKRDDGGLPSVCDDCDCVFFIYPGEQESCCQACRSTLEGEIAS